MALRLPVISAHSPLGQRKLKYLWIIGANDVYSLSNLIPCAVMEDITEYSPFAC